MSDALAPRGGEHFTFFRTGGCTMRPIFLAAATLLVTGGCGGGGPEMGWATEPASDTVDVRRVTTPLIAGPSMAPSPDGSSFAGLDPQSGRLSIARLGGGVRAVPTGGGYWPGDAPRFSRDGRRVAFNWYPEDGTGATLDIRIVPVEGGAPRTVHHASYSYPADFSPDGAWLAVVDFDDDATVRIRLAPLQGGEPLLVRALDWRAPNAVRFSPDGRFLAYDVPTGDESLERDIAVYDLVNGGERRILDDPANDLLLGWSPTGELYFQSERAGLPAAWRVRMTDGRPVGEPELLKADFLRSSPVGFTSGGDFFYAIRTGGPAAFALSLDERGLPSGPARPLTAPGETQGGSQGGAVSNDGRLFSYVGTDNIGARRDNQMGGALIKVVGVDGGPVREFPLPPRIRGVGSHRWMANGTGLIFRGNEEGRYGIFRLDFRSGEVARLFGGGGLDGAAGRFRFDLAPDGSLVFIEDVSGSEGEPLSRLVVRDLGGGPDRVLLTAPGGSGPNVAPVVSPDGRRVAYYGFGAPGVTSLVAFLGGGPFDLMVAPIEGGEPRRVATTAGGSFLWTPDGAALIVSGPEITRVPVAGGAATGLGIGGEVLGIDPMARTLVFSSVDLENRFELWRMSAGGAQ